jgi:hypothetical protein
MAILLQLEKEKKKEKEEEGATCGMERRKKKKKNLVYLGLYYFGAIFEFLLSCWFVIEGCKMGGLHKRPDQS